MELGVPFMLVKLDLLLYTVLLDSIKRYIKDPGISFFLFGPRGTGKTTWLKNNYSNVLYFDLLDESLF